MSETVQLAIVTGLCTALPAMLLSWLSYLKIAKVERKADSIEHATNSMKDELVASKVLEGKAQGVKEEKEKQALHAQGAQEEKEKQFLRAEAAQAEKANQTKEK